MIPPPAPGEGIRSPYLVQEHEQNLRNRIVPIPPLYTVETNAGTAVGISGGLGLQFGLVVTNAIPAATVSNGVVVSYKTGRAQLYTIDTGTTLAPDPDQEVDVLSDLPDVIPVGARVRLGSINGRLWILGYIC